MDFFYYYLIPFVIVLGVLIFFHELGHFLIAKMFGVKVLKFALGFGPRILWKKMGETEYSIRSVPLGGFVKMLGEDVDEENEPLKEEESERSFSNQHVLKRIAIVAAGPCFNLFLAFCIFFATNLISGDYLLLPKVGQVTPGSAAEESGLQKGDVIISVEGRSVSHFLEIKEMVHDKAGIPLEIIVDREGELFALTVVPSEVTQEVYGQEVKTALIGIVSSGEIKKIAFGPWGALKKAGQESWSWIVRICHVIVQLFERKISLKAMGGPLMIGQMTGDIAQQSFSLLFDFTAAISINLGILNLFPIPILDGGLILFLLLELVIGKPISIKNREWAQKVGFALLIFLMAIVTINDFSRLNVIDRIVERIFG